ncbi:hypothetical protein [Streptomyces sp. NPDC088801]
MKMELADRITVAIGDATSQHDVSAVVLGQGAVVSVLGACGLL